MPGPCGGQKGGCGAGRGLQQPTPRACPAAPHSGRQARQQRRSRLPMNIDASTAKFGSIVGAVPDVATSLSRPRRRWLTRHAGHSKDAAPEKVSNFCNDFLRPCHTKGDVENHIMSSSYKMLNFYPPYPIMALSDPSRFKLQFWNTKKSLSFCTLVKNQYCISFGNNRKQQQRKRERAGSISGGGRIVTQQRLGAGRRAHCP